MRTTERLILVADDEKSFRDIVGRSLAARHYRVAGAGNGAEALRLAREERPELILLDQEMPKKSGREVLRELRSGIQTRSIPVIMLSGSGETEDRAACFDLGADGYLTKPFDMKELGARVDGLLLGSALARSADALTRLPGSPMIEAEVNRRIRQGSPFSFSRLDIDKFSAFNKANGYELGDALLLETAGILLGALADGGLADDFAGHMGGDDFVAITSPERAEAVARAVTEQFDSIMGRYFPPRPQEAADARTGGLSVGVVSSATRRLAHYARVVELSFELVRYLKGRGGGGRSAYLLDRRSDFNTGEGAKNEDQGSSF